MATAAAKKAERMFDVQHMGGGTVTIPLGRKIERSKDDGLPMCTDEGKNFTFGPGPGREKFAIIFDGTPKNTVNMTEREWEALQELPQVKDLVKRNLLVARLAA